MLFEPHTGKRYIETHTQHKAADWAHAMQTVSDELYPEAEKIVVVMDNLNAHKLASFYETFQPEDAHRLSQRFEINYTPKHGSWLNMAEIELSALVWQCLNRRIPDEDTLDAEAQAWTKQRNDLLLRLIGALQPPMLILS